MFCKKLLYAPLLYGGDVMPLSIANDTLYYKWQIKLWEFFESKKDWEFIWKAIPRSCHTKDPFQLKKSDNIRYSSGNLNEEMKNVEMVYLDYPSTPFYDAKKAGKMVLCTVLFGKEYLRENVEGIYISESFEDSLDRLDRFLEGEFVYGLNLIQNKVNWEEIVL